MPCAVLSVYRGVSCRIGSTPSGSVNCKRSRHDASEKKVPQNRCCLCTEACLAGSSLRFQVAVTARGNRHAVSAKKKYDNKIVRKYTAPHKALIPNLQGAMQVCTHIQEATSGMIAQAAHHQCVSTVGARVNRLPQLIHAGRLTERQSD